MPWLKTPLAVEFKAKTPLAVEFKAKTPLAVEAGLQTKTLSLGYRHNDTYEDNRLTGWNFYHIRIFNVNANIIKAFANSGILVSVPVSNGHIRYINQFDQLMDAFYVSMKNLGFSNVEIVVAETEWSYGDDPMNVHTNPVNAATYNSCLMKKIKFSNGTTLMPAAYGTEARYTSSRQ
ncbi:hypothetical protein R6Q57_012398 [Mikania cordata]